MGFFNTDWSWRQRHSRLRVLLAACLALELLACANVKSNDSAANQRIDNASVADDNGIRIDDDAIDSSKAAGMAAAPLPAMGQLIGSSVLDPKQPLRDVVQSVTDVRDRVTPRFVVLPELQPEDAVFAPFSNQIGFWRDVAETADARATARLFSWTSLADGRHRAAIGVRSPGAKGLRLGLLVEQLPLGTRLRMYAPGSGLTLEIADAEVRRNLQSLRGAGAIGEAASTYWLPPVLGSDTTVLEIELASDIDPGWLKVSLPHVSHLWKELPRRQSNPDQMP